MSEARRAIDERARLLGLSASQPRHRTGESEDARAQRQAERAARKESRQKAAAPILDANAEVTDQDEEDAIASIQSIPKRVTKDEEADVMASIMAAMQGRQS